MNYVRSKWLWAMLVCFVLAPGWVSAVDYGTLAIETRHAITREPIGPGTVKVTQGDYRSTKTAGPGEYRFRFENLVAGPQIQIEVKCPGFETVNRTGTVTRNNVTAISVYLNPTKKAQLSTEKEEYAVGEPVVVRVKNPGPGILDTTEVTYQIFRHQTSGGDAKIYEETLRNPTERFDDPLDEGESGSFAWRQKNSQGNQVTPGNFMVMVIIPAENVKATKEFRIR
jgi:hypothetical protein